MRNRHDCAHYDGGFCKKGLPGTLCEIKGCVAFREKKDKKSYKPLTIEEIEKAAKKVLGENPYPWKIEEGLWLIAPGIIVDDAALVRISEHIGTKPEESRQALDHTASNGMRITIGISRKPKDR